MRNREAEEPVLQDRGSGMVRYPPRTVVGSDVYRIDACIRLGKRIDERPYLFPNPPIFSLDTTSRVDGAPRPDLQGATSSLVDGHLLEAVPKHDPNTFNVLAFKRVFVSADLSVSDRVRDTIEALVARAGGTLSANVQECNVLICQYRESADYVEAFESGKTIGSLSWLYWVATHNTWALPTKRLLHYPTSVNGLPGFKDFRICLSNYSGEARVYLENLAKGAGCQFTKTMKSDNTHLITAHMVSEKCDAAREWGITIVNHLWLEESYAKWKVLDEKTPRYIEFPTRTNLTQVVGQTEIDREALAAQFRKDHAFREETPSDDGSDVDLDAPVKSPKSKRNLTSPQASPAKSVDVQLRRENAATPRAFTTPAPKKFRGANKENETPEYLSTGSRSAKAQAAAKLHDLAPDIALYEREKKRRGGVVFGGRISANELVQRAERKRSSPATEEDDERVQKKAKNSKEPLRLRVLVTGLSKYTSHDKASVRLKVRTWDGFSLPRAHSLTGSAP